MGAMTSRATVYFEPDLHRALRLKAAHTRRSMSDLVNDAIRQALREDEEDLAAFEERVSEPLLSYEELLKARGENTRTSCNCGSLDGLEK